MSHQVDSARLLTQEELVDLRREMLEASQWMRSELRRLREAMDSSHADLVAERVQILDDVQVGRVSEADAQFAHAQPPQ